MKGTSCAAATRATEAVSMSTEIGFFLRLCGGGDARLNPATAGTGLTSQPKTSLPPTVQG